MELRLITIGSANAGTAATGAGVSVNPGGPINVVATDDSPSGSFDSTCYLDGSIDGTAWVQLGTFTAEGDQVSLDEPWALLRYRSAGGHTAGRLLTLKALLLV